MRDERPDSRAGRATEQCSNEGRGGAYKVTDWRSGEGLTLTAHPEYFEGAPTKKNPLGVKGAGEAGCVGSLPAVVNAVLDALKEFGVVHIDIPLTSEKVWRAVQDQGAHDPKGLIEGAL